ncbi:hypothetical protein SETIT_4G285500v2 [Setaria italica]|uniref:Exocyst subunit Exo70 family protein n=2 Tax=Setaria italica TaxID=4555 RepID=A0A368QZ89_SETIT|nr:hypothetical protein SETIT_4G285500v2 [Setaria italica]
MAMAGRDGGSSSCAISSSSGTVSTTYASTGSRLSSIILDLEIHDGEYVSWEESEEGQMKRIESLVQELFGAPLLANCSGDMRVLERWFSELGVGWVLHLPLADDDDAPAAAGKLKLEHSFDARSWIRALAEIVRTIRSTASLFPERGSMSMGLPIISEEGQAVADDQFLLRRVTNKLFRRVTNKLFRTNSVGLPRACEEEPEARRIPDQLQFAQFFQQAMLRMLAFVDSVVGTEVVATNGVQEEPYEKLNTLLGVRGALSKALHQIHLSSYSPASADVFRIQRDIISLLAAKEGKTGEAIWSAMQQVFTRIMEEDGNDLLETQDPPESSGIHKATRSVTRYMGFLQANYSSVAPIVSEAARYGEYAPQNGGIPPLDSMVLEMASCLEEKLGRISQLFPNNSLGFLFVINNLYCLMEQLSANPMSSLSFSISVLTRKIKNTIEYYLQVSWAPVLLCLHISHTPFQLGRYCSPLPKFDSEFLKTYEVQKFWKVPNPDLREVLRRAVTEKVVSGLTEYLRDSNTICTVRTLGSSFTPQELEEMLQELYEG